MCSSDLQRIAADNCGFKPVNFLNYAAGLLWHGMMVFDPATGQTEKVDVDMMAWPENLSGAGCAYVEELHRVYVLGGIGHYLGEFHHYIHGRSYFVHYIELSHVHIYRVLILNKESPTTARDRSILIKSRYKKKVIECDWHLD